MKILLIVDDYLPHSIKVAAKMMHELAVEFKKQGHVVNVLTPLPLQKEKLTIAEIDGIEVLYFRSGEIKNTSKINRAINETLLSRQAWSATKSYFQKNRFDGIVYYSPTIFWGLLVKRLRSQWKCNSYLILRDIFPQWTVDNGLMNKKSPIYWYFKFFEWLNYNSAGKIGVMSPSNIEFFKSKKQDISKFEVLFNWMKIPEILENTCKYRKELNLENKIVFFYGGNIGHAQKMIILVNLAKRLLDNTQVHFLFVGKGDEVELILREKEAAKLENITYHKPVDQDTYFQMLNEFDVGLFSLHPDHKTHNFPGKLLGYMAYAKPILGCVNAGNDLKEVVNEAGAGFVVDATDSEGLYEAAVKMVASKELRDTMGLKGTALLQERFSVENAVKQILKALQ
jgi:glycosyltransferase involved in cell wall biosynthesis